MKVRAGLAIGGLALIVLGLVIGFGWFTASTADAIDRLRQPIRTVALDNDSGDVIIRTADTDTTTVRQHFEYRWDKPDAAFTVDGDTLTLADCGWNCSVNYEVTVPRGTALTGGVNSGHVDASGVRSADVDVDSGDIQLADIEGPVTVNADSGQVTLTRITGDIALDADSGDINGTELNGPVRADVSSGSVQLRLATPQNVTTEVDSGDVELVVPDADYRVRTEIDSGDVDMGVPNNPSGKHLLDLNASSGNIRVRTG